MSKIANYSIGSVFDNNSTPESDIRSKSKRRGKRDMAPQDSDSEQTYVQYPGSHDGINRSGSGAGRPQESLTLDPELANLSKVDDSSAKQQQRMMEGLVLEQLTSYRPGMALGLDSTAGGDDQLTSEEAQAAAAAMAAVAAAVSADGDIGAGGITGGRVSQGKRGRGTGSGNTGIESRMGKSMHANMDVRSAVEGAEGRNDSNSGSNNGGSHTTSNSLAGGNGGSFTQAETQALEAFMRAYQTEHGLDHAALCRRVWANERKKDNFWDAVASALPHRTRASVYKHVRRKYHTYEQRGKWTPEEDEGLRQMVELHGAQWKIIGHHLGRMPEDCRDRWRNYVKCGNNRGQHKWSPEEENKLFEIVNQIKLIDPSAEINWTVVSERMGGIRSRIQCRYKWKKLNKHQNIE
ncbi:Myb-like DNA-binding domain-containing protein [Dipodascopsis uninucleata]